MLREPVDFTTGFVFTISPANKESYGDGLAFFIAANGSLLDGTVGTGSSLGLPVDDQHPFVAGTFDINSGSYSLGINLNSVDSSNTALVDGVTMEGQQNSGTITYDSGTKWLHVSVSTTYDSGTKWRNLSRTVNLQDYFPESVIVVGFSASTGSAFAQHKIISWKFTSTSAALVPSSPIQKNDSLVPSGQTSKNESQVVLPTAPGTTRKRA
ncbi:lectin 8-like [Rosa rugosa]|uniref:lectin 8-like n=1 Tax=Rosa rugosa TaxID=74645 RepID=UPI002B415D7D|nr:lectin 8-like [Rosa rugosa]